MSNEQKIQILRDKRDIINNVSPSFCTAKWLQTTLYLQNGYNHSCHRPDPYEASGWTAYCEAARVANGGKFTFGSDKSLELKKQSDKSHALLQEIEAAYEAEDEAMMIRLIKARDSLWT